MKTATPNVKRRPFHEAIVDVINDCRGFASLMVLGQLIQKTKIPANHKKIIAAWIRKCSVMGWCSHNEFVSVVGELREQMKEAAAEAAAKRDMKK